MNDKIHNPFPALSETEYELLLATIREEARKGAKEAILTHLTETCREERKRVDSIDAVVFGRSERGVRGLDDRILRVEETVEAWADDRQWFKRMVYTAVVTAVVGVVIAIIPVLLR